MINITIFKTSIHIEGHADSAPHGEDIVCASVTSITDFVILILDRITDVQYKRSSGVYDIFFKNNDKTNDIIKSYVIALKTIANFNPKHVKVELAYAWI